MLETAAVMNTINDTRRSRDLLSKAEATLPLAAADFDAVFSTEISSRRASQYARPTATEKTPGMMNAMRQPPWSIR